MKSSKAMGLVIALAAAYSSVLVAADETHEALPKPNWQVKYQSGSFGFKKGTWLRIAFVADEHAQRGIDLVTVPREHITAIRFSAKVEKDSELLEGMQRSGCAYARSMLPQSVAGPRQENALLIARASPGVVSRAAEKLNRRHSVRLVWNDRGTEQFAVLAINDCEYAAFLSNLRELLGARWQSVQGESD
jgi:hypothetical protein